MRRAGVDAGAGAGAREPDRDACCRLGPGRDRVVHAAEGRYRRSAEVLVIPGVHGSLVRRLPRQVRDAGEGADAIWLAARGWRVTAVDISSVALARAAAHAAERGADIADRIEWRHEDLMSWHPARATFDLVSAQYLHLPPADRAAVFDRLAAAVAPGGTLLIVGHHPSDLQTTVPRPPLPELLYTGDDIAALLVPGDWHIVTNDAPGREATDPDGNVVTIHDTVFRAARNNH